MSVLGGMSIMASLFKRVPVGLGEPGLAPGAGRESWQKPDGLSPFRGQYEWLLSDLLAVLKQPVLKLGWIPVCMRGTIGLLLRRQAVPRNKAQGCRCCR